ncbi:hypothetical protein U1Q18_004713 [Sarracenia purpurea var. burkii]
MTMVDPVCSQTSPERLSATQLTAGTNLAGIWLTDFRPENLYFICLETNDLTEIKSARKKRIGFWNILDGEEAEICGDEPRRGRSDDVLPILQHRKLALSALYAGHEPTGTHLSSC